MAHDRIVDFLPEIYDGILPEFFDRPLREERYATCRSCVMCPPAEPERPQETYFSPSTKCCTFHPVLPNYLVGALLLDNSGTGREGRGRILAKIASRVGTTPLAILPPARVRVIYMHGQRAFGRAESMLCPYFDREGGTCTVWAQREGQCATWFCKHNEGEDGREFWTGLRDYLFTIQRVLVAYTLRELGFEADRILDDAPTLELGAREVDGAPPSDAEYLALWGAWVGREVELYTSAHDIVSGLDRERYAQLAGIQDDLLIGALAKRHAAMIEPVLPDPLVKNPSMRIDRDAVGGYLLTGCRGGETRRMRQEVYDLLSLFDGRRSTSDVRASIRAMTGWGVNDSLLVALYHNRILVGASSVVATPTT